MSNHHYIEQIRTAIAETIRPRYVREIVVEDEMERVSVLLGEDPDDHGAYNYFRSPEVALHVATLHTPEWFRRLPDLRTLHVRIPDGNGSTLTFEIDRTALEYHYNISFELLAQPEYEELWRVYHLPGWDTADERKRFVERFCVIDRG